MNHAAFLRKHIEAIVPLTDEAFSKVLPFFKLKEVAKKELLIKAGQRVTSEFLVIEGLMKAFMHDDAVKEHVIQFAMEGWWISDYPAYATQGRGDLCVQALEDCIVFELSMADKQQMCTEVPAMHAFHARKAFGGYVALQKRVLSFMKNSAKEKYDLLLEQYPALFQRVPKTLIAAYLGVTRETLSRLSKK